MVRERRVHRCHGSAEVAEIAVGDRQANPRLAHVIACGEAGEECGSFGVILSETGGSQREGKRVVGRQQPARAVGPTDRLRTNAGREQGLGTLMRVTGEGKSIIGARRSR